MRHFILLILVAISIATVFDKGLVIEDTVGAADVLDNQKEYDEPEHKRFESPVLAYVTPWYVT